MSATDFRSVYTQFTEDWKQYPKPSVLTTSGYLECGEITASSPVRVYQIIPRVLSDAMRSCIESHKMLGTSITLIKHTSTFIETSLLDGTTVQEYSDWKGLSYSAVMSMLSPDSINIVLYDAVTFDSLLPAIQCITPTTMCILSDDMSGFIVRGIPPVELPYYVDTFGSKQLVIRKLYLAKYSIVNVSLILPSRCAETNPDHTKDSNYVGLKEFVLTHVIPQPLTEEFAISIPQTQSGDVDESLLFKTYIDNPETISDVDFRVLQTNIEEYIPLIERIGLATLERSIRAGFFSVALDNYQAHKQAIKDMKQKSSQSIKEYEESLRRRIDSDMRAYMLNERHLAQKAMRAEAIEQQKIETAKIVEEFRAECSRSHADALAKIESEVLAEKERRMAVLESELSVYGNQEKAERLRRLEEEYIQKETALALRYTQKEAESTQAILDMQTSVEYARKEHQQTLHTEIEASLRRVKDKEASDTKKLDDFYTQRTAEIEAELHTLSTKLDAEIREMSSLTRIQLEQEDTRMRDEYLREREAYFQTKHAEMDAVFQREQTDTNAKAMTVFVQQLAEEQKARRADLDRWVENEKASRLLALEDYIAKQSYTAETGLRAEYAEKNTAFRLQHEAASKALDDELHIKKLEQAEEMRVEREALTRDAIRVHHIELKELQTQRDVLVSSASTEIAALHEVAQKEIDTKLTEATANAANMQKECSAEIAERHSKHLSEIDMARREFDTSLEERRSLMEATIERSRKQMLHELAIEKSHVEAQLDIAQKDADIVRQQIAHDLIVQRAAYEADIETERKAAAALFASERLAMEADVATTRQRLQDELSVEKEAIAAEIARARRVLDEDMLVHHKTYDAEIERLQIEKQNAIRSHTESIAAECTRLTSELTSRIAAEEAKRFAELEERLSAESDRREALIDNECSERTRMFETLQAEQKVSLERELILYHEREYARLSCSTLASIQKECERVRDETQREIDTNRKLSQTEIERQTQEFQTKKDAFEAELSHTMKECERECERLKAEAAVEAEARKAAFSAELKEKYTAFNEEMMRRRIQNQSMPTTMLSRIITEKV